MHPPAHSDNPPAAVDKRFRWWYWLILALILIIGRIWIWSLDEPAPDVSDLKREVVVLKDEENAYVLLSRIALDSKQRLTLSSEDQDLFDEFSAGRKWDAAKVATWLTAAEPIWASYEQAAALRTSQAPPPKTFKDVIPEVGPLQQLTRLASLRARNELMQGRPEEALCIAMVAMNASTRIQQSHGPLISYLIGSAQRSMTLALIDDLARDPSMPADSLRQAINAIAFEPQSDEGLRDAFRSELRFFEMIQSTDRSTLVQMFAGGSVSPTPLLRILPYIPLCYKPHKTKRLYAEILRDSIEAVGTSPEAASRLTDRWRQRLHAPHRFNPENMIGRAALESIGSAGRSLLRIPLRQKTHSLALQLVIALRLHQRDRGTLPASLDALVPAYLPAMPIDPYSGTPFRYSSQIGAVWSAGEKNLQVTSLAQNIDHRDVVVFLTPPPSVEEAP